MLSWSGKDQGIPVDLPTLTVGVPHARELLAFAAAAASPARDNDALAAARADLSAAAGEAVMVDAAAVVANFEMMTRLADGRKRVAAHGSHPDGGVRRAHPGRRSGHEAPAPVDRRHPHGRLTRRPGGGRCLSDA